jgi:hypothetical protein
VFRRACSLALLALALSVPFAAAQQTPAAPANDLPLLSLLAGAQLRSCPPPPQICNPDDGCIPDFSDCTTTITDISFVRLKDNGMCVYRCGTKEVCKDSNLCTTSTTTTFGGFRVRIGPYAVCPAADLAFCGAELDE